jgi:hypothetical protein
MPPRTLHLVRERSDLLERIRNTARNRRSHQAAADPATRELRSLVHDGFALKIPGPGGWPKLRELSLSRVYQLPNAPAANAPAPAPAPAPSAISPPARRRNSGGFFEYPIGVLLTDNQSACKTGSRSRRGQPSTAHHRHPRGEPDVPCSNSAPTVTNVGRHPPKTALGRPDSTPLSHNDARQCTVAVT